MARVRLLARQSLTRADSVSIDSQVSGMTRYFEGLGHTITGAPITAENTRGWKEQADRADLTEALAAADRREYDILGVWSIDRLARSVRILENVVHDLEGHHITFESRMEPWASDPFLRQIAGAIAEKFTRDLSARVTIAVQERVKRGRYHGRPPLGYIFATLDIGGELVKRLVVSTPAEAELVRHIYAWWLDGLPASAIADRLNAQGVATYTGAPWHRKVITDILTNPTYAGRVQLNGEVFDGIHEPIIDPALWDEAQRRFLHFPVTRRKPHESWVDGLVTHSCGNRMYLEVRGFDRKSGPYAYYRCRYDKYHDARCTAHQGRVPAKAIEAAARACLITDLATVVTVEDAIATARTAAGGNQAAIRRATLDDQRALIDRRHERARERWLDGRESHDWMDAEDLRRTRALVEIEAELSTLPTQPDPDQFAAMAEHLATCAAMIRNASADVLRRSLMDLGVAVVSHAGVQIRYHAPYASYVPAPTIVPL